MAAAIAYSMGKGGVGKTTLAVNFAWYLSAVKGYKTLLVDWDPQASATSIFFDGECLMNGRWPNCSTRLTRCGL